MSKPLRFDGKVVVITGAGAGIGRQYALFFASRGAKIVVNDLGGSVKGEGASSSAADKVVEEIKAKGGVAVANYDSVEFGDKIIKTAMDAFGRVDVVINNAGILRDIAFQNMSEADWNLVLKVHLQGTFSVSRAAWNVMRNQNFGRIINTASGSGLYGNFGQANYSAAKLGIHGLTLTLAKEGEKRNIRVNTIAPVAATRMTETVLNKEMLTYLNADNIVPLVAYLAHEESQETGSCFELGGGYISKVRFERSHGVLFDLPFTPEDVRAKFEAIGDFSKENEYPTSNADAFPRIMENVERLKNRPAPTPQPQQTTQAAQPTAASSGPELKSDKIFALMNSFLARGDGKKIVESLQAVYLFEITPKKGAPVAKTFVIDLKNGLGKVYEGKVQADATFTMVDDDFEQVCLGKLNPQNAFMQGKMKIKGNMKKATAFTPELFPPPTPENFAKYNSGAPAETPKPTTTTTTPTTTATPTIAASSSGLKCESIFGLMNNFLAKGDGKHLVAQLQATYMFEITPKKGAPVAKSFIIDLKNGQGKVYEGKEQVDAIFTMVDEDFEQVCLGKLNPQNAFMQGKMKIKGNMKKATAFTPELFPPPTPENYAKYNSGAPATGTTQPTTQAATPSASTGGDSGLKSSKIFEMMGMFLNSGEGAKLVKAVDAIYIFEITPKKGAPVAKKFVIDLKTGNGKVYEGAVANADATFTMADDDFEQVCSGKLNPQNAFMQGKMKIKGNMKKATLFTPELFPPPTPENMAKYLKPKL